MTRKSWSARLSALAASVVCALALAIPAAASASPELRTAAGAKVPVGEGIQAESQNLVFSSSSGSWECPKNVLTGAVTSNSGTEVAVGIESANFTGTLNPGGTACKSTIAPLGTALTVKVTSENMPWCLKSTSVGSFSSVGGGCGGTPTAMKFKAEFFLSESLLLNCTYERASLTGSYKSSVSPLIETLGAGQTFAKVSGSGVCPASVQLSGSFTIHSAAGGALQID